MKFKSSHIIMEENRLLESQYQDYHKYLNNKGLNIKYYGFKSLEEFMNYEPNLEELVEEFPAINLSKASFAALYDYILERGNNNKISYIYVKRYQLLINWKQKQSSVKVMS